jgi:1,4-dihydroxy-2-naphthoyl-CoA hydrolase
MSIWNGSVDVQMMNALNKGTLGEHFEISFTEVGPDHIAAKMPVNHKTKQPFGLLHGGASVALAETLGSVASWACINRDLFMGVGIEINANHVKSATQGFVTGVCKPVKVGGKLHVWEIRITDEQNELVCLCRFTCMIVPLRK